MLNSLVLVSLVLRGLTATGEEFISHVEEKIEQVKDTFEQQQRPSDLQNEIVYGNKFVDLDHEFGRGGNERMIKQMIKEIQFEAIKKERVSLFEDRVDYMINNKGNEILLQKSYANKVLNSITFDKGSSN